MKRQYNKWKHQGLHANEALIKRRGKKESKKKRRSDDGGQLSMAWMSGENEIMYVNWYCPSTIAMERKNEHQGEIKDPKNSTAEFVGRTKIMKEKIYKKITQLKNERENERDRWHRK